MFLNLTQHLVEKVMLQNITTTTTTTKEQRRQLSQTNNNNASTQFKDLHKKKLNVRSSSPQVWLRQQKNEEHTLKRRIW
jgi:hypothetical protein